jgi:glycosyltransferase involved in cell wall biosynthesis
MEAMACGIPCVGFNTGGIPEMIDHEKNGYVARYRDAEDLAQGILYCMEPSRRDDLSREAVRKTQRCWSQQSVAKQYLDVYEDKGFKTDTVKTDTITAEADKDKTDKE